MNKKKKARLQNVLTILPVILQLFRTLKKTILKKKMGKKYRVETSRYNLLRKNNTCKKHFFLHTKKKTVYEHDKNSKMLNVKKIEYNAIILFISITVTIAKKYIRKHCRRTSLYLFTVTIETLN